MPGIHLDISQIFREIAGQLSDPVDPCAGGLFEAVEFIDGHHDVPPATAMCDRDRRNKSRVLDLAQPSLQVLRAKLL
ncbi:hypothetical protein AB7M16_002553 [Bradyrhizobium sp. USDA 372]|nr:MULTISPECIES: hypothetical protein [Bradyrhizobium]